MAIIDNAILGDKLSLTYLKESDKPSENYVGFFESQKGAVLTLKIEGKGFRSFTISKIVGISVG